MAKTKCDIAKLIRDGLKSESKESDPIDRAGEALGAASHLLELLVFGDSNDMEFAKNRLKKLVTVPHFEILDSTSNVQKLEPWEVLAEEERQKKLKIISKLTKK